MRHLPFDFFGNLAAHPVTHGLQRAHRAAHPERFPLRDETKKMHPALKLVETATQPTPVHLQVYDGMLCSNLPSSLSEFSSFIRCGPCPSSSFPIHDTWKVLLPRDGFVCWAHYGHASSNGHPSQFNCGSWHQRVPCATHAAWRNTESRRSTTSKSAQIAHVRNITRCV